jgi:hypothetical protein
MKSVFLLTAQSHVVTSRQNFQVKDTAAERERERETEREFSPIIGPTPSSDAFVCFFKVITSRNVSEHADPTEHMTQS